MVFPSPVRWVPEVHPSSGDRAPEKRSPGTAFCPGWETQFTGGQASEPPTGKNRPYCPWRSRLPECVTPDWCLTDLSSATAWPSKPGPRPTWRRVWVRICKNCQRLQQMSLLCVPAPLLHILLRATSPLLISVLCLLFFPLMVLSTVCNNTPAGYYY